jgi:hypothetical protein
MVWLGSGENNKERGGADRGERLGFDWGFGGEFVEGKEVDVVVVQVQLGGGLGEHSAHVFCVEEDIQEK